MPHVKYPEEAIFDAAFEMTRDHGMEKVTADAIAAKLGCSKSPIYTVFKNMDELKTAVLRRATKKYTEILFTDLQEHPPSIQLALNYVRFAREYPHLFKFMFLCDRGENNRIINHKLDENKVIVVDEIQKRLKLTYDEAVDHYIKMGIFCNGIAAMIISKTAIFNDKDIARLITEVGDAILPAGKKRKG